MKSRLAPAIALAAGLIAVACSPIVRNHGYVPPDDQLRQLQVGRDDRDSVSDAIGQPTAEGILDDRGWYYVQSQFRQFGVRDAVEVDREVVAISFDSAGRLANIERFGLERGRVVRLSRRVTESNARGTTFLRQLFRNVGNVDASQFVDQ